MLCSQALVGEASTVGWLVSCKGYVFPYLVLVSLIDRNLKLVELIIPNGGLEAGIMMFVLNTLTLMKNNTLICSLSP